MSNLKNILKACLHPKILLMIGGAILLAYLFFPKIAGFSWILFVLVCPLSMVLMMAAMKHEPAQKTFVCAECGLAYEERSWAQKCTAWCTAHHSCNLEIAEHAVNK